MPVGRTDKMSMFRQLVLIKFRPVAGVFLQNLAGRKFFVALREPIHFIDDFVQTKMFGESKRSATEGCESGTEDHSVIGIFGRRDDFFFHTTRGFVHHEKHKAVAQSGSGALAAGLFETTRRGVASTPFLERFIRSLRFAFVFVKTAACFSTEHSTIAQPMQDG